jgi:toxin ParE1/3/4
VRQVILLRPAEADIDDIWTYSAERWGFEQADHYLDAIEAAMNLLADNPMLGRSCDEVLPSFRRKTSGSHVIFYMAIESGIEVARILHVSMDYDQHL